MKIKLLIVTYFISFFQCFGQIENEIDRIKTDDDVVIFLKKHFNKYSRIDFNDTYFFNISKKIADSLNIKNWSKSDFDNNGMTDLLVSRKIKYNSFFVILAIGNNTYKLIEPLEGMSCVTKNMDFPKVDTVNNSSVVKLYQADYYGLNYEDLEKGGFSPKIKVDTLIYKFDNFIELSKAKNVVKKITLEYESWGRKTKVTIKKNKRVKYVSYFQSRFLNSRLIIPRKIKIHKAYLEQDRFDKLWNVLKYINLDKLESNYKIRDCEDATGVTLKLSYNNKLKTVNDYGLVGTYGLAYIYDWENKLYNDIFKK